MVEEQTGRRERGKTGWRAGGLLLLTALATLPASRAVAQLEAGIAVGSKAPVVVINDLEGVPVNLGSMLGTKPVLIQFWATWCELCQVLLPQLETIQRTYGDRIALFGVNVTVNDSKARIRRYQDLHRPPYRVLFDDKGVASRAYDVPTTSFVVVVDSSGKVAYTGVGSKQDLVAAVAAVFKTP